MDDIIVDELSQVATHFKKSLRQVQRWMRAGAPRLSDGSFDLVQIKRWLKQKRKGLSSSPKGPAYGYCRGRLGELVEKETEARLLAGLADVEVGLNTIAWALGMHGEMSEELKKLIVFFLQTLAKPLLKQVGDSPPGAGQGSILGSQQVRLILE
jgi:hypothetical protein